MDPKLQKARKIRGTQIDDLGRHRRRAVYLRVAERSHSGACQEFLLKSGDGLTAQVLLLNRNLDPRLRASILGGGAPWDEAMVRGSRPGGLEWSIYNRSYDGNLAEESGIVVGELGALTG